MYLTDRLGCSEPPGKDAVLWFLGFLNRYKFGIKSTLNSFTHTYLVGWNSCAMLGIYRERWRTCQYAWNPYHIQWVWVTHQWMSAKASVVPGSVTRWKLSSLWQHCLCSQGHPAVSPAPFQPCLPLGETKGTTALPKPASQSFPISLKPLKKLDEDSADEPILLSATGHKEILTAFQTTYYNQWIFW